jgi:urease accessory protein UreF
MLQPVPAADSAAEIAAWWRLVELCLPSHEECGALTFSPSGPETLGTAWDRWVGDTFQTVLHPSLLAMQNAAAAQDSVRLLAEDAALGAALPADAALRSLSAGRHLLHAFQPPQGAKLLERLRDAVSARADAGHLATVFAVRGQIFHLPSVQVAGALLLAECVAGADAAGVTLSAGRTIEMMQFAFASIASVPAVQLLAV